MIGTKQKEQEVRRQAVAFVRDMGVVDGVRSAARWEEPVCPRALGLAAEHARIVEAKLRKVAATASVPLAREPCRTNITVSFVSDAGTVVRAIAVRSRRRFSEVPSTARPALLGDTAPIRWWYSTQTRNDRGMSTGDVPIWATGNADDGGVVIPTSDNTGSLQHHGSSLISTQAKRAITNATVLVDVNLAEGVPLDTVASYAALVAFAEIRIGSPAPSNSILAALDTVERPREPTAWDFSFLRALYRLPLDREARQQRGRLVRALVEAEIGR